MDSRGTRARRRFLQRGLIGAAIWVVVGCAAERPVRPGSEANAYPFIVTCWCGPPLADFNDDRAAELAAAGFTVVGPPCEGGWDPDQNLRALDVAHRHGLGMWVADHRFVVQSLDSPAWQARLASAVADYRQHPAVYGYFVADEPTAANFAAIAAVVDALRSLDPDRLAYVNLLPDFIPPSGLGSDSYEEYIERFVAEVRPQLLSYDYYPFGNEGDRVSFLANLTTVRAVALRHALPFMLIVQAMPHAGYRDPSEAELAWQVFHALAFGAQGISYFSYWTPSEGPGAEGMEFRYGLMEHGKPTLHYFQAKRLNHEVRAIAQQLASYRSIGVADSVGEIASGFPVGPIRAVEGGRITAGLFTHANGSLAVLLVNRDYRYGAAVGLRIGPDAGEPEIFDVERAQWVRDGAPGVVLSPGGARLLRWSANGG